MNEAILAVKEYCIDLEQSKAVYCHLARTDVKHMSRNKVVPLMADGCT